MCLKLNVILMVPVGLKYNFNFISSLIPPALFNPTEKIHMWTFHTILPCCMSISCKQPAFYHVFHTEGKVQIGNNQSRSPLWNIILVSWSLYLHLFEIAIYLWLGFIGDTTKFLFAFRRKIWWNYIFGVTNCWWISLIFSLLEERQ